MSLFSNKYVEKKNLHIHYNSYFKSIIILMAKSPLMDVNWHFTAPSSFLAGGVIEAFFKSWPFLVKLITLTSLIILSLSAGVIVKD